MESGSATPSKPSAPYAGTARADRGFIPASFVKSVYCQPLDGLVAAMLAACPHIHCLRDATRGGVATVLNEFAEGSHVAIRIHEAALPLREEVKGACEILGLDPLYLANEGKLVAVVPGPDADRVLAAMRAHPAGARGHHRRSDA